MKGYHDPIDVPLPNRDLVDADHARVRVPLKFQLLPHVDLVHLLDRVPVEAQVISDLLDRGSTALLAHVQGEAPGVVRIGCQPVQALSLHAAAVAAVDPTQVELEIDTQVAAGQIPDAPSLAVVPGWCRATTAPADRFFGRRVSPMTRASASPAASEIARPGTKPGNRYASRSSRLMSSDFGMHELHPGSPVMASTRPL